LGLGLKRPVVGIMKGRPARFGKDWRQVKRGQFLSVLLSGRDCY
jgi:hypothetical protein